MKKKSLKWLIKLSNTRTSTFNWEVCGGALTVTPFIINIFTALDVGIF